MSNAVAAVDAVVLKVEQYALVLVGGGIAAFTAVDPTTLPHKWGASLLVANGILITLKPYLQKALKVTQSYNAQGVDTTIATVVDRVTGDVKHVVAEFRADVPKVEVVTKDEVKVAKDEVNSAPAAVVTADQTKAAADAAAARADLEKQAAAAKATLASVEAALNANPTVPAGPGA